MRGRGILRFVAVDDLLILAARAALHIDAAFAREAD